MLKRSVVAVAICACLAAIISLSGCETCKGTGRDISNLGKMISGD